MFLPPAAAVRRFNEICNHPDVLPWVREPPYEPLDLTQELRRCVVLTTETGGVIAVWRGGELFEIHAAFLPTCRGCEAAAIARHALAILFVRAGVIFAAIPAHNRGARRMAIACGLRSIGATETLWRTDFGAVAHRLYAADRLTWTGRP